MNIVDKFLYRLIVGFILLLSVVLLDKYQIVEYDYLKSECSKHFNALNLINRINGKTKLIPIDFGIENTVSKDLYERSILLDGERKVLLGNYEAVENYALGTIINISINKDDTYKVVILGNDDLIYIYDKLESCDCYIYELKKPGDIIGKANYDIENYFMFSVMKDNYFYDILGNYEN